MPAPNKPQYYVTVMGLSNEGPFKTLPEAKEYAFNRASGNSGRRTEVIKASEQIMFTYTPQAKPDPIESNSNT